MTSTLLPSFLTRAARLAFRATWVLPAFLGLTVAAQAQTAADIAPAALAGKTLSLNATSAGAPFQGIGLFTITFANGNYTMPISDGNPAFSSGTYTATQGSSGITEVVLNGYLVGSATVQLALVPASSTSRGIFEMYANGLNTNKSGTFSIGGGSTGGGTGAPVVSSPATATATVGAAFTYQIAATPAATSYTNTGGNAPVAINPTTGLVTGTFTTAGTFTFSYTALNAAGASAVRTVTVTVTAGSTGGGSATSAPVNLVGYRNKVGQTFQFNVTGANSGAVWGTDVYTDDSSVSTAAVHAGVLAVGETKTVTLTILPGQSAYTSTTRNGVKASAWGAWSGSYSFAGAGVVTGTSVATARPTLAPGFTATTTALAAGGRLVLPVSLVGGGTYSYQWYLNGISIAGATANPYVIESLIPANAGTYSVDATNSLGTSRLIASTITVGSTGAPVISLQPLSKLVSPGGTFALAASASGTGNTYQWLRNGTALAGETGQYLLRQNVTASDAGTYAVRITNSAGTVTSQGGVVTLSATASRPANISCRTNIAAGSIVTPGFVIQGSGTKNVLIRAVGPTLGGFGVPGVMPDPQFKVIRQDTGATIASNDNWDASLTAVSAAVGAFALTPGSRDAAAVVTLTAGQAYTVQVSGVGPSSGVALIEVYDADTAPTSKLVNVSVRGQSGRDADVLILGLVIQGTGQRTLLIRGGGPALAAFGVQGTVADPRLEVFDSNSRSVLTNDDWSGAAFVSELEQARQFVGAFAFAPASKDAATLALLAPGAYTIQVSGANNGTGEALVEVYEVP